MAKRRKKKSPNLSKLCHILVNEFDPEDFYQLCSDLKLNCEQWNLNGAPAKLENVLMLVGSCYQLGLVNELLTACDRIQAGIIHRIQVEEIYADWIPEGQLSDDVIQRVNAVLGILGRPHIGVTPSVTEGFDQVERRETNCYCWVFLPPANFYDDPPSFQPQLKQVREALVGKSVFVYLSELQMLEEGDSPYGYCLVVAPTRDQFDAIRIEQTDGNGVTTEDILRELTWLDKQFGMDILAVDYGSIVLQLKQQPQGEEYLEFIQWFDNSANDAFRELVGYDDAISPIQLKAPFRLWWD